MSIGVNRLQEDLDHFLKHTEGLWEEIRGKRIFITGGTGFFGCWLLESFALVNEKLNLNATALILSRNPEAFEHKAPHLFHNAAISFLKGDVQNFEFPEGDFSHVIHASVYQHPAGAEGAPLIMVNEMLQATKHVLEFCVHVKAPKFLLVCTGAVYGTPPPNLERIPEDFGGSFDPTVISAAYHHVRRMMECISVLYAEEHAFEVKIARCFSFIGPYLPLNGRFAAGDFVEDALANRSVIVKGDGKQVRSYLYAADLAICLWTILFKGKPSWPYNVGSEIPTTILELAETIASGSDPPLNVQVLGKRLSGVASDHYVPDTTRAQSELGVQQTIPLVEAIRKTIRWYRELHIRKES